MNERISDLDMDLIVGGSNENNKIKDLDLPLLTLIPIPSFDIDNVDVTFNMKTQSSEKQKIDK